MATYPLPELRRKWGKGELTLEQVLGHVVQHLLDHLERLNEIEKPRPEGTRHRARQLEQSRPSRKPSLAGASQRRLKRGGQMAL